MILPRDKYHIYRNASPKPIFIRAQYALNAEEQAELGEIIECESAEISEVIVSRDFDGNYTYEFPNEPKHDSEEDDFIDVDGVTEYIESHMPKYVYYSNYGNLDSQIFLPQVLQNMNRTDLGVKDAAKARTLEYCGAAEPPVRCGESHLSGLTEPPQLALHCYLACAGSNP